MPFLFSNAGQCSLDASQTPDDRTVSKQRRQSVEGNTDGGHVIVQAEDRSEDGEECEPMAASLQHLPAAWLHLTSWKYRIAKRALDLVLLLIFAPLAAICLGIICAVVAITSDGPLLYTQERIGRYGQSFRIFKFRTMRKDAEQLLAEYLLADSSACLEWLENHKLRNDPRVTMFGRFLRRTSLDELPQLINVLRGEMSLVGPRPIVRAELDKYGERFYFYSAAVPGLTGLWQVSGRCDLTYSRRVSLDEVYVCQWSLLQDLLILLKTPRAVWRCDGAY